jgi:hypothetical protein
MNRGCARGRGWNRWLRNWWYGSVERQCCKDRGSRIALRDLHCVTTSEKSFAVEDVNCNFD